MIDAELYVSGGRPLVVLERRPDCNPGAWARLQEALNRGVIDGSDVRIDVRADVLMAEIGVLREIRTLYGESTNLGPTLTAQIRRLAADRKAREASLQAPLLGEDAIESRLLAAGFVRQLKSFQIKNVASIQRLPHGADFSVPGAGKTTVALANFALNRMAGTVSRLLVVAPIAAFEAWKEDAVKCLSPVPMIAIHEGVDSIIPEKADILLTNYNRVALDYDRIRSFVSAKPTQVVLDEAHRIKRGAGGVHGRSVLDLAYAAQRRDVLTGTPAPQGAYDLIALIRFLYPGQDQQILPAATYREKDGREEDVLQETQKAIKRYFVRTTKKDLSLPATRFDVVRRPMGSIQRAVYDALLGRYMGSFQLASAGRREFDRLGRVIMYLLEAATNPILLVAGSDAADQIDFAHPPIELQGDEPLTRLLATYHLHETPWKYREVHRLVEEAARNGQKVLVWSSFVRNIQALARYLKQFEPAVVHGGVPPESAAGRNAVTRDSELARFRKDPGCSVLLANPAACGEGVSLHHECHHAVYLDRTFNAGQFLQSQDRIHRLGLADDVLTKFTILVSQGTIDETVDGRLRSKVEALSALMDDPGLVLVALPEADDDIVGPPVQVDDAGAVLAHLQTLQ